MTTPTAPPSPPKSPLPTALEPLPPKAVPPELANRQARLSIAQYEAMVEAGILPSGSPIELLDGHLVYKDRRDSAEDEAMTVGTAYSRCTRKLIRLLSGLPESLLLMVQQPIRLTTADSQPEPDIAIVLGPEERYAEDAHPCEAEVVALVEIADSSLKQDTTTKLSLYAAAGVPQYVVVDLAGRKLLHFSKPVPAEGRFASCVELGVDDELSLLVDSNRRLAIPVRKVLP